MSAINYTATKNLVKNDVNVAEIDISALASDDTFNSVAGDFLGMLAGEWVLVSGSAVDDGWHEMDLDSTASKIFTLSSLTDEVAGSLISVVGYKHGLNQQYDLETASQLLDQIYMAKTNKAESLSGVVETLLFNEIEYWSITTGHISESELPYWLEFFSSVRAGNVFTFDPYGTTASPNEIKNCILDGNPDITRVDSVSIYSITFKVRVV